MEVIGRAKVPVIRKVRRKKAPPSVSSLLDKKAERRNAPTLEEQLALSTSESDTAE